MTDIGKEVLQEFTSEFRENMKKQGASSGNSELLPCPFCGRHDLLDVEATQDGGFLAIKCRACGCTGPSKLSDTRAEAAAHWNKRAR